MIKYRQTENIAPEFEMPKIEGYKKQFSFKQPQGVKEEEIVIEEPEPEVKEEPEFSERELEVLQTDGTAQEKADVTNKYLQKRLGLTNEQAAALVGVWKAESGFNLNAENAEEKAGKSKYVKPTEYGIGIGQWTKSRHNDYVNYIRNNGGKNNLQTQLDFAIDEIQNKYSDYLNNLRTAENVQDATAYTYTQYVGGAEKNIRDLDDLYARVRNMEQKYINAHRQIYGKAGSGNFDRRVRFATESLLAKLGTKLPDIRKPEA